MIWFFFVDENKLKIPSEITQPLSMWQIWKRKQVKFTLCKMIKYAWYMYCKLKIPWLFYKVQVFWEGKKIWRNFHLKKISKANLKVFIWTKNKQKYFCIFCPSFKTPKNKSTKRLMYLLFIIIKYLYYLDLTTFRGSDRNTKRFWFVFWFKCNL